MLFNVFEPKLVDSLLYAMIEFFNHGIQGTATWSQLSLVPPHRRGGGGGGDIVNMSEFHATHGFQLNDYYSSSFSRHMSDLLQSC